MTVDPEDLVIMILNMVLTCFVLLSVINEIAAALLHTPTPRYYKLQLEEQHV